MDCVVFDLTRKEQLRVVIAPKEAPVSIIPTLITRCGVYSALYFCAASLMLRKHTDIPQKTT